MHDSPISGQYEWPILLRQPELLEKLLGPWFATWKAMFSSLENNPGLLTPGASFLEKPDGFDEITRILAWWCDASGSGINPIPLQDFDYLTTRLSEIMVDESGGLLVPDEGLPDAGEAVTVCRTAFNTAMRIHNASGSVRSTADYEALADKMDALLALSNATSEDVEFIGPQRPSHWAALFDISVKTFGRWRRDGDIRSKEDSTQRVYVAAKDVEKYKKSVVK